eukprot:COSAG05_NODE_3229_length_2222_cov_3.090438_2_plen_90_part_00
MLVSASQKHIQSRHRIYSAWKRGSRDPIQAMRELQVGDETAPCLQYRHLAWDFSKEEKEAAEARKTGLHDRVNIDELTKFAGYVPGYSP